jgi:hypothetical protein
MRNTATAYASSASTDVAAYEDLPGHHLLVVRNLIATTNDESYHGSASELPLATLHGYAEWDFSGVPDPVMFQRFLDAADYWFGYSDDSNAGIYDPARECFMVAVGDVVDGASSAGAGGGEPPPGPRGECTPEPRAERTPTSPARGADITAQLAQARELEAKLAKEYLAVRLLRASIAGETSARGERVRELGRQARERINTDFNVNDPNTPPASESETHRSHDAATGHARSLYSRGAEPALRGASTRRAGSRATVRKLGVPHTSAGQCTRWRRRPRSGGVGSLGRHGRTTGNQGQTLVRERILDTRGQAQDGDARNIINACQTSNIEARAAVDYHPWRGGRYDSHEDRSPTPEPPGTRVFSREIHTTSFPKCFRQPTSIDKYTGETDPQVWLNDDRLACQLVGATTDEVIICNLPLHLTDSARTLLEHLPPSQIHNWDDLVRTFTGNF